MSEYTGQMDAALNTLYDTSYAAGFKAGREQGMRDAVGIIQAEKVDADTTGEDADEAYNLAITHCTGAILAAIWEKHD